MAVALTRIVLAISAIGLVGVIGAACSPRLADSPIAGDAVAATATAIAAPAGLAPLNVDYRFVAGATPLSVDAAAWQSASGQAIRLQRVAMLLSGFRLCRADGGCVSPPDSFGLLDLEAGRATVRLPALPTGDYASVGFTVGLPPMVNRGDPALHPAEHPLNPLVNGLHWSWQAGYVFAAIEGHHGERAAEGARAEGDPRGVASTVPRTGGGFVYHLANDGNTVEVSVALPLRHDGQTRAAIDLDLASLIEAVAPAGITAGPAATTHSRPGDALVVRLKAGLAASFRARSMPEAASMAPAATAVQRPEPLQPAATVAQRPEPLQPAATTRTAAVHSLALPPGFLPPSLPADNRLSRAGIALGERLFHEPRLSRDASLNCASCHPADRGLVEAGRPTSIGVAGAVGERRAMPLLNLAWSKRFGWDGGQARLSDQALRAIAHPREMALDLDEAVARIAADADYRTAFAETFDGGVESDGGVDARRIGLALEQFLLSRVSANSRIDLALQRRLTLTDRELEGFRLFMSEHDPSRGIRGGDCFHCHGGPLFTSADFHNNGLDGDVDPGRARVTGRAGDAGRFKSPSLRNVALRPPYMHDGRFETLAAVVAHYSRGTVPSATLDPNLAKHPDQAGLQLTGDEEAAIVAFLEALTDLDLVSAVPSPQGD